MVEAVLIDAGFIVALLSADDTHHQWAASQAAQFALPWRTCEAALSEAFQLLGRRGVRGLSALVQRRAIITPFELSKNIEAVLKLMTKYSDVSMSLADACLVRMTEVIEGSQLLTTD